MASKPGAATFVSNDRHWHRHWHWHGNGIGIGTARHWHGTGPALARHPVPRPSFETAGIGIGIGTARHGMARHRAVAQCSSASQSAASTGEDESPADRSRRISGWWGAARKINYTGDWLMGLSWCLFAGNDSLIPYFYRY